MPWLLSSPGHRQLWYWLCKIGPGLIWRRILSTCVISMWSNDIKSKYMFHGPPEKFSNACEGLKQRELSHSFKYKLIKCRNKAVDAPHPHPHPTPPPPLLEVNSLRPRPNRRHFADDIFKCIFENGNERISPRISRKFVPKVWINNIPALVQIMAWRRPGDKSLSEPMMVSLLTHICVTRPQWVKSECTWVILNSLPTQLQLNRLVSQMRAPLAPCRKPAGKLWQLCKVLYVF